MIHTSSLEGILLHALQKRGVVVEQPFVPQSLKIVENKDDPVETYVEVSAPEWGLDALLMWHGLQVTVAKLDEEYIRVNSIRQADRGNLVDNADAIKEHQVIRAKYVLGCDGEYWC